MPADQSALLALLDCYRRQSELAATSPTPHHAAEMKRLGSLVERAFLETPPAQPAITPPAGMPALPRIRPTEQRFLDALGDGDIDGPDWRGRINDGKPIHTHISDGAFRRVVMGMADKQLVVAVGKKYRRGPNAPAP